MPRVRSITSPSATSTRECRARKSRPFVTGSLAGGTAWYLFVAALLLFAVVLAGLATNWLAAAYVFLGAFTYGVVYTMWLKRRTWINIVIGGLAGSFAVLAGAAAIDPMPGPAAWTFAVVLFLWTPPHFWSLAMYYRQDYADAGVPMLPVVFGDRVAAKAIFWHTMPLVALSLLPLAWGAGWLYGDLRGRGRSVFHQACLPARAQPDPENAIRSFLASLLQLGPAARGRHRRGRDPGQPGPLLSDARRDPADLRSSPRLLSRWRRPAPAGGAAGHGRRRGFAQQPGRHRPRSSAATLSLPRTGLRSRWSSCVGARGLELHLHELLLRVSQPNAAPARDRKVARDALGSAASRS